MAFRSSTNTFGTGTSYTIPVPSGVASGDIVLLLIGGDDNFTSAATGFTAGGRIAAGGSHVYEWLWKVAGGSEGTDYTITSDFNSAKLTFCLAFSGRGSGTPASASTALGSAAASPLSVALTGLTAATGDDIVWFGYVKPSTGTDRWTFAAPASYTEADDQNRDFLSMSVAYRANVSSGATGTLTGTATRSVGSANGSPGGFVIALAVAGAGSYTLTAEAGTYALTGNAATLTHSYPLTAAAGTYALTGNAATLTYAGAYTLTAEAGSYAITGQDALVDVSISAESGSYTLTGQAATLTLNGLNSYTLTAAAGAYALTGQATGFAVTARQLAANQGTYTLSGRSAGLLWSGAPVVPGNSHGLRIGRLRLGL